LGARVAEIRDMPRVFRRTNYSILATLKDFQRDLTFNLNGGTNGFMNKIPADKNNRYLNYQKTPDMRILEQILKGHK
jgi:hypothetical protein